MFEVLECSWHELLAAFEAASDFDGLLAAHKAFLGAVVQKALLGPGDEPIYQSLKALFEANKGEVPPTLGLGLGSRSGL